MLLFYTLSDNPLRVSMENHITSKFASYNTDIAWEAVPDIGCLKPETFPAKYTSSLTVNSSMKVIKRTCEYASWWLGQLACLVLGTFFAAFFITFLK